MILGTSRDDDGQRSAGCPGIGVLAAAALRAFPIVAIKLWLLERIWRQGGGVRRAVTCLVQVTGYVGLWSASVLVETAATRVTLWG